MFFHRVARYDLQQTEIINSCLTHAFSLEVRTITIITNTITTVTTKEVMMVGKLLYS